MKDLYFVVVKENHVFDNGDISLLMAVSSNAADLAPETRKGSLATLTVKPAAIEKGLGVGAAGMLKGDIVESKELKDDKTPWLRVRKEKGTKIVLSRAGSQAVGGDDVEFLQAEEAPPF
jgi:hypothetical protein